VAEDYQGWVFGCATRKANATVFHQNMGKYLKQYHMCFIPIVPEFLQYNSFIKFLSGAISRPLPMGLLSNYETEGPN
jgi:hypothetical protein